MERPIVLMGQSPLRAVAEPVTAFDRSLRRLVKDMTDTMVAAQGLGLAAPQVGVEARVFTYKDPDAGTFGHVINPTVEVLDPEPYELREGCLSIPGFVAVLARPRLVRLTGWDASERPVEVVAEDLLAKCFQHEDDHLDGILFVDHLSRTEQLSAEASLREYVREHGMPSPHVPKP